VCFSFIADPQVQEKIQNIIDNNPDQLDEAIENDPELKALRDANPLCQELMSDPQTMKILTDPDNLRALNDCPELIQADFGDPNWVPPDIETPEFDDANVDVDAPDIDDGVDGDGQDVAAGANPGQAVQGGDNQGGFLDNYERGEAVKKQPTKRSGQSQPSGESRTGAFLSSFGTGLIDYIANETVGMGFSEIMGADDGWGGLEGDIDGSMNQAADQANNAANGLSQTADFLASDNVAGNLEDAMDNIEDAQDASDSKQPVGAMGGAAAREAAEGIDEPEQEGPSKKGRFGRISMAVGSGISALSTAAKEQIATTLLGDDFGQALVEKLEECDEEDGDDEEKSKNEEGKEEKKSKRFFQSKK
jgi:hypothetical protein